MRLPITDPVLIMAIAIGVFLLAPMLVERVRLPGIVGLILAGALVGPNGLALLERSTTIVLLGTVGLLYLMFLAGVEIDLDDFKRYRNRSLVFGAITFALPQLLGTGAMRLLGYDWPAAVLIGSMLASHTLLAYPIAVRFGIGKNRAVTTAVGGTIITDTVALLVLAVVAASTRGTLDAFFWGRLVVLLAAYVAVIWYGLPALARWFFRHERAGGGAAFLFVLGALFGGAFLAELAGVEPIVGAFLVGLSLNRLIPEHSLLASRLHFVGDTVFIPFFLFSVGMLVDVRVLFGDLRAWTVMLAMTAVVVVGKFTAARLTQRLYGYSPEEGWTIFGLSVGQAAATLAAVLVGLEIGLLDDTVLNGAILTILVSAVVGPLAVETYGRRLALREAERPYDPREAPQRILVPMANPASADALMDLALAVREPGSREPVFPLTVVPAEEERAAEHVALAERMLSHAVAYGSASGVPVVPLTRVDHNFASGIARGVAESRISTVVIGWDGRRGPARGIFGSVLDQLLERTRQQLVVAKLGHPLNTTQRLLVLVPHGSDRVPGFLEAVRALKLMASRLSAEIHGLVVGDAPERYAEHFRATRPEAPVTLTRVERWTDALQRLEREVRANDLVVGLSARRGAVSWVPALESLPARLAGMVPESFLVFYLSESQAPTATPDGRDLLARALSPGRILLDVAHGSYTAAVRDLLGTAFGASRQRLDDIARALHDADAIAELRPGVSVARAREAGLTGPMLFLATSDAGIPVPGAAMPTHLLFVLLTPEHDPDAALEQMAAIARLVSDDARLHALREATTPEDVLETTREEGAG